MTEQYEKILSKWDSMTPRERDALVAEKVMGWESVSIFDLKDSDGTNIVNGVSPKGFAERVPHYSTDISAAFEAAEKIREKYNVTIDLCWDARIDGRVSVEREEDKEDIIIPYGKEQRAGFPKTLTEAMSKAFVLAVMGL